MRSARKIREGSGADLEERLVDVFDDLRLVDR